MNEDQKAELLNLIHHALAATRREEVERSILKEAIASDAVDDMDPVRENYAIAVANELAAVRELHKFVKTL